MIQRIQTVFLLLAIICLGLFLWAPLIGVEGLKFKYPVQGWELSHTLRFMEQPYIYFFNSIFTGTAIGFAFIALFLFPLTEKSNNLIYILIRFFTPVVGWIFLWFRIWKPEYEFSSSRIRSFQTLLCWFSILFIVSAEAFTYYQYQTYVSDGDVVLTYWNLLAVAAVVLQMLAFVYIKKDENLLKSVDRLRD